MNDEEVADNTINFLILRQQPDILEAEVEDKIHYSQDITNFYSLDPTHTQTSNLYFMESTIRLMGGIWDLFQNKDQ